MDATYEVGQHVQVQRKDRVRAGVVMEIRKSKVLIKWDEVDSASAPISTLVPKAMVKGGK